jgi:hypothetical protein
MIQELRNCRPQRFNAPLPGKQKKAQVCACRRKRAWMVQARPPTNVSGELADAGEAKKPQLGRARGHNWIC